MVKNSDYICEFCGESTYSVDEEYLCGKNHLSCDLESNSLSSTILK